MNRFITPLQSWWQSISQREKRMVVVCSVFALVAVVFWGVLQPMSEKSTQAKNRVLSEKQLVKWVTDNADKIVALRQQGGVVRTSEPLNQLITASTRRFNVELGLALLFLFPFRNREIKRMEDSMRRGNSFAFLCHDINELEHSRQVQLPRVSVVMPLKGFGEHNLHNWRSQVRLLYARKYKCVSSHFSFDFFKKKICDC